ncbi:MAG: glycosyltransferase [Bacteroidaceae bacterium]|nr:glycosyltransferase [Bacteroidaceae bacterium]
MSKEQNIAVFDFYLGGHHIEYLHHIYMHALQDAKTNYTFILPNNFDRFGERMSWPEADNISFTFFEMDDKYVRSLKALEKARMLSRLLKKYANETGIKEFVLIEIMVFMPYLPFYLGKKIRITSILYHLPLFCANSNLKNKVFTNTNFQLMAKFPCFKKICLLNSEEAVEFYNKKFRTKKFSFIPDPYVPIECEKAPSAIRESFGIVSSKKVFIHFGGLTRRKGTLEILDALINVDKDKLENLTFVFAGRVIEDIKEEFYNKINQLKEKVQIIVFDQFCEYSLFAEICRIADYIMIPYRNTAQSSGVCSYAAQFGVPVIGPAEGLLGNIIKGYGLGIGIENLNSEKIANFLNFSTYKDITVNREKNFEYLNISTPKNFFHCLIHSDI